MEYSKIDSVFMRDQKGKLIVGEYARPEYAFLAELPWVWTEKVDGTNIRLGFPGRFGREHFRQNEHEYVQGRSDNAQLPPKLLAACVTLLKAMPLEEVFLDPASPVVLYGEGYGAGIQKGGQYRPDPSFVLFDVRVGNWWLRRSDVEDVAAKLGLDVVPIVANATLIEAVDRIRSQAFGEQVWFESRWPGAHPEGIVGRPEVDLSDRRGDRIITKLKFKDFT